MTISPTVSLLHGDCVEVMRSLPARSVDAVITSPPYAMQRKATYGGVAEADYPEWTVAWMREARRLLKPDGSVVINISPHVKAGELSDYVLRTRLAIRADGWTELDELIWLKPDALPTGHRQRPRRSWESLLWYGLHGRAWSDAKANGLPPTQRTKINSGRAARNDWPHLKSGSMSTPVVARVPNVAKIPQRNGSYDRLNKGDHPAAFPPALAEWVGRLICPPGGTVLDPFSGSGSTGLAALRNGWSYVGIDAVVEYVEMSKARLAAARS